MARAPSAVLSKADIKTLATNLKAEIKSAKDNQKQLAGIRKEADKVFALAGKAHLAALKENDKAAAVAAKAVAQLEAKLSALTPTKVAA